MFGENKTSFSAGFATNTGELTFLGTGLTEIKIADSPILNEQKLISVCRQHLQNYTNKISDRYTVHIKTRGATIELYEGYLSPLDYPDKDIRYEVAFSYCIDGVQTKDSAVVCLNANGEHEYTVVSLKNDFLYFKDCNIDMEQCKKLIDVWAKERVTQAPAGYTYIGYEIDYMKLDITEGKLCMEVGVLTIGQPIDPEENEAHTFEPVVIIIPVA